MSSVESKSTKKHPHNLDELFTNVQYLKGVGPERARVLAKLDIHTVVDLLFNFPRRYQDFTSLVSRDNVILETDVSFLGEVLDFEVNYTRAGKLVVSVFLQSIRSDSTTNEQPMLVRATWFNQDYLKSKFQQGQVVLLQGKMKQDEDRFEMVHPKPSWIDRADLPEQGQLIPVYSLTEGLSQPRIRQIVKATVESYAELLEDVFPDSFRQQHSLVDIVSAVKHIHTPSTQEQLDQARYRLIFQELFVQQAALAMRRNQLRDSQSAPPLEINPVIRSRILNRFPFDLTQSQQTAVEEIADDMQKSIPMNRLLHGEVGSGKTAVATFAILLAIAHGYQAVMMAPTEILVEQHIENLKKWLHGSRVEIESWTGSLSERQRAVTQQNIHSGKTGILVGTQALTNLDCQFKNLGLVVIDEQHKFGVRQRALVRSTGQDPHYLVMTATPIPRTISMTLYGDLDVSTLEIDSTRERKVNSYLGSDALRDKWWQFFCEKLDEGRQGYVVAPYVESGDKEVASVESLYEALANGPLEAYRIDILHGKQKTDEKLQIMHAFSRGHTQVLIATSVVEVGIDVPNATVMTIDDAERFGLSQLHQLRGRVGRGAYPGYVCVFPSSKVLMQDPENDAIKRLEAFVKSADGFELAEIDLQIRGPGDFFSSRQHGFPPLHIADLSRDFDLLMDVRQKAKAFIQSDPKLVSPDFARLRTMIFSRYGESLELSDVG